MFWVFDLVIALVIASVPLFIIERRRRKKHFHFIEAALVLVWLVVFYGSFIEPRLLTVREYEIDLSTPPHLYTSTSFRIVLISDTHFGPYKGAAWAEKVVQRIAALRPDVVVLAGDLVSTPAGLAALPAFRELASERPVYAVLGNWDYRVGAVEVRQAVEATGVEVLTNESVPLAVGDGQKVRLIGLDDLTFGTPDLDAALAETETESVKIVAVHNPDIIGAAEVRGVDLVLAGHTHAGQVRLPLLGAVPPLPTELGRRYDRGLFPWGRTQLFITPGVGESGPRARLLDPSEISLLKIRL